MTYPNERPPQRDRYILVPIFILAPAILVWGVLLPAQRRMAESRARVDAANAQIETISHVTPLTAAERAILDDPKAPWRSHMPLVATDLDRLNQYARVVTGIQARISATGGEVAGVRSSWDPIRANFTTPTRLTVPGQIASLGHLADATVTGWALEVQTAGPPASLGRAISVLPQVDPLLIPIGLRWEARDGRPFQALILRDLYLAPAPPPSAPPAS